VPTAFHEGRWPRSACSPRDRRLLDLLAAARSSSSASGRGYSRQGQRLKGSRGPPDVAAAKRRWASSDRGEDARTLLLLWRRRSAAAVFVRNAAVDATRFARWAFVESSRIRNPFARTDCGSNRPASTHAPRRKVSSGLRPAARNVGVRRLEDPVSPPRQEGGVDQRRLLGWSRSSGG